MLDSLIFKAQRKIQKAINGFWGNLGGNRIDTFWYLKNKNFGDLLNPDILRYYGLIPLNTSKSAAQVITAGSILQSLPNTFAGYIIGSGLIDERYKNLPKAKYLCVRGALTRERLNAPDTTPLGDPGLLVSKIYPGQRQKRFTLGIVPHYADKGDSRIKKLSQSYPKDIKVINVQRKPKKVVREIDRCEYILSSSLHGLITADALRIPNGWLVLSDKVRGAGFKFYDYTSAINRQIKPIKITGTERLSQLIEMIPPLDCQITEIQENLDLIFRSFVKQYLSKAQ